jgi:hypothetical protein
LKGYKRHVADSTLLLQLLTVGKGIGLDVEEHATVDERDRKSEKLQKLLQDTKTELGEWDAEVAARGRDNNREREAQRLIEQQRWAESEARTRKKTPAKAVSSHFFRNQSPPGHKHEGSPYDRGSTREGMRSATKLGVVSYPVEDDDTDEEETAYLILLHEIGGISNMNEGAVFDIPEPEWVR